MDGSMRKYGQLSPGRAKVWTEKSPKYQQQQKLEQCGDKVPIVYYLSSKGKLEHPHFMEVPVSSSDGLRLRDVIERLNAVRGRGIAAKYSWSCKRSYKNGYVWHDLCEEDLLLPANGNEYVLKGSELFEESHSGGLSPVETKSKLQQEHRIQDDSSSSSNVNGRTRRGAQTEYLSPTYHRSCSSAVSPDSFISMKNSVNCPLRFVEASTQTDLEAFGIVSDQQICSKDCPSMDTCNEKRVFEMKEDPETSRGFVSPPLSTSSKSFPSYQTNTLEALIRADIVKLKTIKKCLETEGPRFRPTMKLKPANLIMQLISCGSIYVKDHNFDVIPSYNHLFTQSMFSSPTFMTGECDSQLKSPRGTSLNYETKEYFTESLAQAKLLKEYPSPSSSSLGERQMDAPTEKPGEKPKCDSGLLNLSPWRFQSS